MGLRDELDQDGLIKIVAGNQAFRILDAGRRVLEHAEADQIASITVNANNSNVQFQNNSPHATQTANIGDEIQEARTFVQQLSTALPEIQKVATADQFTEIKDELEFLKKKLDSPTPPKTMIKTIKDELIKRVIGLPFDAAKWFGPEILERL